MHLNGQSQNGVHAVVAPLSPGEAAVSMTGRDYLSYSQVSTYQMCSLRWWYTYHQGYKPETLSAAMLLGSGVHAAIEKYFQAIMAAENPPTIDQLMETYQALWAEETKEIPVLYTKEDTAETTAATAKRMLEQFLVSPYAMPDGTVLGLEEPIRFTLAETLPDVLSKVDMIEHRGNELVITDFKTARSLWSQETALEHADQLLLYGQAAQAMAQELEATIRLQFLVLTKAKTPKIEAYEIPYDADRVEGTKAAIKQVFKSMQLGVVYPSPSTMNCSGCPHQNKCKTWYHEVRP